MRADQIPEMRERKKERKETGSLIPKKGLTLWFLRDKTLDD